MMKEYYYGKINCKGKYLFFPNEKRYSYMDYVLSYNDRDKFCGEFHKRLINENGYYKLHKGYFIMEYRIII